MSHPKINPDKKTIIFDFGNVLIDLDFKRCFDTFEEVTGLSWDIHNMPTEITSAIHKYDRGHISDEAFLWTFQQHNSMADPRDLIRAWNSLIGDIPQKRFSMLESLRPDYNLVILSNINNLHLRKIHHYLKKAHQITDFEDRYFDHVFYSHLIGMRKPDDEIYPHVTDVLSVNKSDILFIDDLPENIEAAKSYGWHGQVHHPEDEIQLLIQDYINKLWSK